MVGDVEMSTFIPGTKNSLAKSKSKVVAVTSRSMFNGSCVGSVEFTACGLDK